MSEPEVSSPTVALDSCRRQLELQKADTARAYEAAAELQTVLDEVQQDNAGLRARLERTHTLKSDMQAAVKQHIQEVLRADKMITSACDRLARGIMQDTEKEASTDE